MMGCCLPNESSLDGHGCERLFATIEHHLRETIRVVTHFFTVVQQVRAHDLCCLVECLVYRIVDTDLISALSRVELGLLLTNPAIVYDYVIEMDLGCILLDRFEMLARVVAVRLTGLRHQVVDEDLCCTCLANHRSDLGNQEVR